AKVYAPFDGIIIEGELEKMLGAPVRKGDILFKIGTLGKMYAEIDIDERDIHEIKTQATGRASLVSRPHLTFSLVVNQITPVSTTKDEGNVFQLRAQFNDAPASWWRPGMRGVAHIDIEERPIFWILTHRVMDYFRLLFWW
ncbi:HlyD family efflux transporter periplasmic adaptor subunit, partial [Magnetococcales bacterium HHB-1]